jgi:hypothetical protein
MIWNYRYGENSANGYMTQYVQYRSDRLVLGKKASQYSKLLQMLRNRPSVMPNKQSLTRRI